jgi:hypothetical protein
VRNDLKAIDSINDVETDVNVKSVTVQYAKGADISAILNQVAEKNSKLKDWEIIEE